MARYRKIDPKIWNDAKFRGLSDAGKLVFLFLLTHPHMTSLGAMRTTIPGLAAEMNWTPKAFTEAFGEAMGKGLFDFDETASCVVIPRFLKYNGPESPNVVNSWRNTIDLVPECTLKDQLIQTVKALLQGYHKAYREALPEAFDKALPMPSGKPCPYPEQEQEPEPEPEHEHKKEKRAPWFESFVLTEDLRTWCTDNSMPDPTLHLDEFLDHFRKTAGKMKSGQLVKDPAAAFRTWMRNTVKFSPVAPPTRKPQNILAKLDAQDAALPPADPEVMAEIAALVAQADRLKGPPTQT